MKRIVRKQLKEDEFISTVNKIALFVKERSKEISIIAAAAVALVLIYVGIKAIQAHKINQESRILGQIFKIESELKDNPEKIEDLENLAGTGKYARLGYIKAASFWIEKGELDKAVDALNKVPSGKKDLLYYQSQDLKAQAFFKLKKYDDAVQIYQELESDKDLKLSLDIVLFHKAEILEEQGNTEEALALYKKVQEDFPQTYFGFDASQKVQKLEEIK
jgi:predicted negative regulator of RcsB-dependent stress response